MSARAFFLRDSACCSLSRGSFFLSGQQESSLSSKTCCVSLWKAERGQVQRCLLILAEALAIFPRHILAQSKFTLRRLRDGGGRTAADSSQIGHCTSQDTDRGCSLRLVTQPGGAGPSVELAGKPTRIFTVQLCVAGFPLLPHFVFLFESFFFLIFHSFSCPARHWRGTLFLFQME